MARRGTSDPTRVYGSALVVLTIPHDFRISEVRVVLEVLHKYLRFRYPPRDFLLSTLVLFIMHGGLGVGVITASSPTYRTLLVMRSLADESSSSKTGNNMLGTCFPQRGGNLIFFLLGQSLEALTYCLVFCFHQKF